MPASSPRVLSWERLASSEAKPMIDALELEQ
jgi:hypothetical protein